MSRHDHARSLRAFLVLPVVVGVAPAFAQSVPSAPPAVAAPSVDGVTALLLRQSRYWRERGDYEKASSALAKAVQAAPDDPSVLEAQGDLQVAEGNLDAARRIASRLTTVASGSPAAVRLHDALRAGAIDPATLQSIRSAASAGRTDEAVSGYHALFGDDPPPRLAPEYYSTLGGTTVGWDHARVGLAGVVRSDPNDLGAQLAFARVLTYRQQTRAQGIARLRLLASMSNRDPTVAADAAKAWREALLWLPNDQSSVPSFQAWLAAHPDDQVVSARATGVASTPAAGPGAVARAAGFSALTAGQTDEAADRFSTALSIDPKDADALGGLGLARSRQGRNTEAADLFGRAIAADPANASHWRPALDGLSVGTAYATAHDLVARGRYDEAERSIRALVAAPGDSTGALLMLADLQIRRRQDADAEATYAQVLDRRPNDADALLGLARLQARSGRSAEAARTIERLGGARHQEAERILHPDVASGGDPADEAAAASAGSLDERIMLLRRAADHDPGPWVRLHLAQALIEDGRQGEARDLMAEVVSGRRPSTADLQAAILFAGQIDDVPTATVLLARLPIRARTPDVRAVADRIAFEGEVAGASEDGDPGHARLLALADAPDPTGQRGVAVARALALTGDRAAARAAITSAERATRVASPAQRLAYAGELLSLGDGPGARRELAMVDRMSASGVAPLTASQVSARDSLADGLAVTTSDRLNGEGRRAEAYDVLSPALKRNPSATAPRLALARLYQSDSQPRRALALDLAVLARDPADLDAMLAAVQAAIDCDDIDRATTIARNAIVVGPEDPRAWFAAAEVHRARGEAHAALADLRRARALRLQQDGADGHTARDEAVLAGGSPPDANPFRRDPFPGVDASADAIVDGDDGLLVRTQAAPVPADPLLASIDDRIHDISSATSPSVEVDVGLRSRSGTGGLDSLTEVTAPVTATLPIGAGASRWYAAMTPTSLSSGDLDGSATTLDRYGTLALHSGVSVSPGDAAGVAFRAGFVGPWLSADAGTTPLGFRIVNAVGGVELSPKLANGVTLRLTAERRAVTDSVLSYAGERDPGTGTTWGGVTRTRGHAQIEVADDRSVVYAGGGYDVLDGTHVEDNTEVEVGVGGNTRVWKNGTQDVRVGVDLTYFAYRHDLRYFTLGQGGYFSPQSYVAAVLPVTWTGRSGPWDWKVTGSLGYQHYVEHASPLYPDDPTLQASLDDGTVASTYPARSVSGIAGGADGSVGYDLTPTLRLGAVASYQKTGDWDEAKALLTARYSFSTDPRVTP